MHFAKISSLLASGITLHSLMEANNTNQSQTRSHHLSSPLEKPRADAAPGLGMRLPVKPSATTLNGNS